MTDMGISPLRRRMIDDMRKAGHYRKASRRAQEQHLPDARERAQYHRRVAFPSGRERKTLMGPTPALGAKTTFAQ